jgi:phytoene synthase
MLMQRWLDAAGITDSELRRCYMAASQYWRSSSPMQTLGLKAILAIAEPSVRPHVATLGKVLAVADGYADTGDPAMRPRRLDEFSESVLAAVAAGHSDDPLLNATAHTFRAYGLRTCFLEEQFGAMRRDAAFTPFATYEELSQWAQAATGACFMLVWPLFGLPDKSDAVEPHVRRMGVAVQRLDNLFDLAEDLRNGRLYLPLEDLDRFGVKPDDLFQGRWSPAVGDLLAFEADREPTLEWFPAKMHRFMPNDIHQVFPWLAVTLYSLVLDDIFAAGDSLLRHSPPLSIHRWNTAFWKEIKRNTQAAKDTPSHSALMQQLQSRWPDKHEPEEPTCKPIAS